MNMIEIYFLYLDVVWCKVDEYVFIIGVDGWYYEFYQLIMLSIWECCVVVLCIWIELLKYVLEQFDVDDVIVVVDFDEFFLKVHDWGVLVSSNLFDLQILLGGFDFIFVQFMIGDSFNCNLISMFWC